MTQLGRTQFDAFLTLDEDEFLTYYYPGHERRPDDADVPRDLFTLTVPEAAVLLDVSRQAVWKDCKAGRFRSLRKVGSPDRPTFLLDMREVREIARARRGKA